MDTNDNADGTKTFHWRLDEPCASYLTSLIVGAFVKLDDNAALPALSPEGLERAVPLAYYTYAGAENAARAAYGPTPDMMRFFSKKTGIPFPFNKYAQTGVAFFDQFAGMENVTATTFADSTILRSGLFRSASGELPPFERRELDNLR